jgi:hypothetical protein
MVDQFADGRLVYSWPPVHAAASKAKNNRSNSAECTVASLQVHEQIDYYYIVRCCLHAVSHNLGLTNVLRRIDMLEHAPKNNPVPLTRRTCFTFKFQLRTYCRSLDRNLLQIAEITSRTVQKRNRECYPAKILAASFKAGHLFNLQKLGCYHGLKRVFICFASVQQVP